MKSVKTALCRPWGLATLMLSLFFLLAPLGLFAMQEEEFPQIPGTPVEPPENPSAFLVNLTEPADLTVGFWYDVEFPQVTLISPSGTEYLLATSTPGINIMIEAEYALVQIPSAEAGDWYIRYDIGKNTEFEFDLMGMTENIWIQYITAEQGNGNRVTATFLASLGEERVRYDYKLYLTYDADGASTLLLDEGYAYTGDEKSLNLNFASYNSYDNYQLLLEVELVREEVTLFDSLESDPFTFENMSNLAAPSGIDLSVSLSDRMLTADWDNYTAYRYNGYRLVITDAAGEVIYSADFDSSATKLTQYISEKTDTVTVTFYGKDDALLSSPLTRTVKIGNELSLITASPTASSQAQFKMNLPAGTMLNVTVGTELFTFTSEGKENVVAATLANSFNELMASFVMDHVTYTLSASIYKDGMPPQIDFYEPYQDKVFPDGKAVLVGSVGDAVSFMMNGKEVTVEDGLFEIKLDLVAGANEFLFEATDAVGNASTFTLTLYGSSDALMGNAASNADAPFWIPLAIGIVIGLVLMVFAIVLAARRTRLKAFSTTPIIVLFSGTTVVTLGMLIWQLVRKQIMMDTANSYDFMAIVRQSLSDAYAYLIELEGADAEISLWLWIFLGSLAALMIAILVHILLKVFGSRKSGKATKEKKEKKAMNPAPQVEPIAETPAVTVEDTPVTEAPEVEQPAEDVPVTEEPVADPEPPASEPPASESTTEAAPSDNETD